MSSRAASAKQGGTADTDAADAAHLERLGYKQELNRVLSHFDNFSIAFSYLSPMVGVYSLFVLGAGTAGPAYIWLMPVVVGFMLLVALVFGELAALIPSPGRCTSTASAPSGRPTAGGWAGSTAWRCS